MGNFVPTAVHGPDIVVTLTFRPTERGGRKGPTPIRIFRCPLEFEGEMFDCFLHLEACGPIAPGMTVTAPVTLLSPDLIKPRLKAVSRFTLWEIGTIGERCRR